MALHRISFYLDESIDEGCERLGTSPALISDSNSEPAVTPQLDGVI